MTESPNIFISYSWADTGIIDKIDSDFRSIGVSITRDVRDLGYKQSLKEFMQKIRTTDYSVILISDTYLKSKNCMYEVLEFSKEINYKNKILPIIKGDCKIYTPESKLKYISHWNQETTKLKELIKDADPIKVIPLISELKDIEKISLEISEFLDFLSGIKLISFETCIQNDYSDILNFIGLSKDVVKKEILKAVLLENKNERDIAIERLIQKYPDNPDLLFERAFIELNEKNNFEKSAILWQELINKFNHKKAAAYTNLGLSYFKLGQFDKAEEAYLNSLSINDKSHQTYNNLGILSSEVYGDYKKAIEYFLKSIDLNPEHFAAHYYIGVSYFKNREFEKSIQHFNNAITLDPKLVEAYNYLMILAISHLKDKKQALEYGERAILHNPNDARSYFNLGHFYENEFQDFQKAKDNYRLAIIRNPNYSRAYLNLSSIEAKAFMNVGRAIEILEDLLVQIPNQPDARFNLAILYGSDSKTFIKGKEMYHSVIKDNPKFKFPELDNLFNN